MTKAEWSGWFQAIGAALAILAAAGIATYQASHSEKIEHGKRLSFDIHRLDIVKALAVRCFTLATEVINAVEKPSKENIEVVTPALMRDVGTTLLALPMFEIPGGLVALDVMTLGRTIGHLALTWDTTMEESQKLRQAPTNAQLEELKSFAAEIAAIAESALKECNKEIQLRKNQLA